MTYGCLCTIYIYIHMYLSMIFKKEGKKLEKDDDFLYNVWRNNKKKAIF